MKADRDDAPRSAQPADRARAAVAQRVELVVDGDTQRLKDARRRMNPLAAAGAVNDAGDQTRELGGGIRQLAAGAAVHDGASDTARGTLFAIVEEDIGQLALAGGRQDVVGAAPDVRIHTHVQRRRLSDREAAFRVVKLHRRNSKIEENAVYCCDFAAIEGAVEIAEVGMDEGKMRIGNCRGKLGRRGIGIQGNQSPRRQLR